MFLCIASWLELQTKENRMLQEIVQQEFKQVSMNGFSQFPGEAAFQRLLDKLPAGAYMCDADGLITYFNRRAVEVWGREPKLNSPEDRFCGSFKLFATDGSPIPHDQCWMALALRNSTEYNGYEIIIERPDGRRLTALAYASPLYDATGKMMGAVNVLADISERKQAEEERERLLLELNRERTQLKELTETLEERVLKRTAQVHDLVLALNLAEERERGRMAEILHNDLQQLLYSQLMRMEVLRQSLPAEQSDTLSELLAGMVEQLNQAVHMTRTLTSELNPPKMETNYLVEALEWLGQHMEQAHGLKVVFTTHGDPLIISNEARTLLLQIVSELLFNVVKHAGTDQARLKLSRDQSLFTISIEDKGAGFDLSALSANPLEQSGLGIRSVSERLALIGGRLEIDTALGAGTSVTITVPALQPF